MNCTPIPNTVLLSIVKLPDQIFSPTIEMVRCSEGFRRIGNFSPISGSFEQKMNTPSMLMSFVSPSTEPCGVSTTAGHLTRILGWSRLSIPILFLAGLLLRLFLSSVYASGLLSTGTVGDTEVAVRWSALI
jgi:hypothetical protein